MIRMIVRHEVADEHKGQWIEDFKNKRVIREANGISQEIDPVVNGDRPGEILVVHHLKDTVRDAARAMDHIESNGDCRREARARGNPEFLE